MKIVVAFSIVCSSVVGPAEAGHYRNSVVQPPPATQAMVDTATVKVLTGLTVQEFEAEMQLMTQALGLSCGSCHARGNFASDANPRKLAARRMIEMTKGLNAQFFADYKPLEGQSRLGRVTCFTCHQGDSRPKTTP
jgi:hypothetical protein